MSSYSVNLEKIKRVKGTVYRLDFRFEGRRIRQTVGSDRRTAQLMKAQIEQQLIQGTYNAPQPDAKKISLDGLIKEFLNSISINVREASRIRYQNYLARFSTFFNTYFPVASADISLIEEKYIGEFIQNAREGENHWSESTLRSALITIKSFFNYAVDEGYMTKSPTKRIKSPKKTSQTKAESFSDEELDKIWATVKPYWVDPLKFMVNTGLRKGELINLSWDHADLTSKEPSITITSTDDWKTKTGESRIIPLNETALEIIMRQQGKHERYVFTSKEGKRINQNKIYDDFKEALGTLGLKGDVHKLRKTFASKLASASISQLIIGKLLGHSDYKSTSIYTILEKEVLRNAVSTLEGEDRITALIRAGG